MPVAMQPLIIGLLLTSFFTQNGSGTPYAELLYTNDLLFTSHLCYLYLYISNCSPLTNFYRDVL